MTTEHRRSEGAEAGAYDSLVATAGNLFAAHDYDQVVLLLEEIPKEQRSPAAKRLLRQATQLADEVADLKVRIDDMVGRERFAGLKEALERLTEIRPGLKRYEGYLKAINTYRHGAAYKVHRAPDGSVRFDPAGSEWTAGTIALLVLLPLLIFGGLYFAVRTYLADDAPLTAVVLEIDDPTVEVAIDDRTLAADEIGVPVQMTVGEHDLAVRRDGRTIHGQRFRITEGNRTVLRIRVKDDAPQESPPETIASTPTPTPPVSPPPTVDPPKTAPPKATPTPAPVVPSGPLVPTIGSPFALPGPDIVQVPPEARGTTYFRCLLGAYEAGPSNRYPYTYLKVPAGGLSTPEIREAMKGTVDDSRVVFVGKARFYVPADGVYYAWADAGGIAIDNVGLWKGRIRLSRGIHTFAFRATNWGGPSLRRAAVGLYTDESRSEEIPLFNSAAEIEEFTTSPAGGQSTAEMSGWRPTSAMLVTVPADAQPAKTGIGALPNAPFASPFDAEGADIVRVPADQRRTTRFRSLLGYYQPRGGPSETPFACLAVPQENILFSENVQFALRGNVDMNSIAFRAIGRIDVPRDGTYHLDLVAGSLKIDGQPVKAGSVPLAKGVRDVEFTCSDWGGPKLNKSRLRLWTDETRSVEIPFFNTAADIDRFLAQKIGGQTMLEVSGWRPTRDNLVE